MDLKYKTLKGNQLGIIDNGFHSSNRRALCVSNWRINYTLLGEGCQVMRQDQPWMSCWEVPHSLHVTDNF